VYKKKSHSFVEQSEMSKLCPCSDPITAENLERA